MRRTRSIMGLSAAMLIAMTAPVRAGETSPLSALPPLETITVIQDKSAEELAKRAFEADPILAPLRIQVSQGIAMVRGPVPDQQVGQRVVALLATITGIKAVRTDFQYPAETPKPPVQSSPRYSVVPRTKSTTANPGTQTVKPITGFADAPATTWSKPGSQMRATAEERHRVASQTPAKLPDLVATPVPAREKPLSLPERVDLVRGSQARFRRIPVDVQGDTIIVRRSGVPSRDATALAQVLCRMPGVSEVLIAND